MSSTSPCVSSVSGDGSVEYRRRLYLNTLRGTVAGLLKKIGFVLWVINNFAWSVGGIVILILQDDMPCTTPLYAILISFVVFASIVAIGNCIIRMRVADNSDLLEGQTEARRKLSLFMGMVFGCASCGVFIMFFVILGYIFQDSTCRDVLPLVYNFLFYYAVLTLAIFGFLVSAVCCLPIFAVCCRPCVVSVMGSIVTYTPSANPGTKNEIAALLVRDVTEADVHDSCVICMECYSVHNKVKVLPCGHFFDVDCIDTWLSSNKICPLCRKLITHSPA